LIYTSRDLSKGWDGTLKGEVCQQDVYVYKITFTNKSDGVPIKKMKGIVTLIR
jgi:hypothetical protein